MSRVSDAILCLHQIVVASLRSSPQSRPSIRIWAIPIPDPVEAYTGIGNSQTALSEWFNLDR